MPRPLLLTGATGFLGRALAAELAGAGYELHALSREGSARERVTASVRWHTGDLLDAASLDRATRAVAARATPGDPPALVHSAALLGYAEEDREPQRLVNVEGTRALLDAARRHGFRGGVHVSSVVAVAHSSDGSARDEYADWNGAELDVAYVTTKRAAEEVAQGFARALELRIVCPGVIFGPGGPDANSARTLLAVAEGRVGTVAPPGGISVVGVADVARATRLALEVGNPGRRYVLVESYLTHAELLRRAAHTLALLGIPAREPRWTVPAALWPGVVAGARLLARHRPVPDLTPQALRMLGCRWRLAGDRARRELGWRPAPFDDVLLETLRDLAAHGVLGVRSSA